MSDVLALFLGLSALAGLVLIPLGLPGLWVIVLTIAAYGWVEQFSAPITWEFVAVTVAVAILTETIDTWAGSLLRPRDAFVRRAGWSAFTGGVIGAILGVSLPLLGSMIGGVVGSYVGALVFEYRRSRQLLLGRAAAVALKPAVGVAMAATAIFAVFSGIGQWQGS
jgi:uncharacterized protein